MKEGKTFDLLVLVFLTTLIVSIVSLIVSSSGITLELIALTLPLGTRVKLTLTDILNIILIISNTIGLIRKIHGNI